MGPRLARMRRRHAQRRLEEIEEGLRWLYRARIFVDFQVQWQKDELDDAYCTLGKLIAQLERERQSARTSSWRHGAQGEPVTGVSSFMKHRQESVGVTGAATERRKWGQELAPHLVESEAVVLGSLGIPSCQSPQQYSGE